MLDQDAITPAIEPADFKRAVHIVEDDTEDDLLIQGYILAAQAVVETGTGRPMTQRTARINCRATGFRRYWFPVCPVTSIIAIRWQDGDTFTDLPLDGVHVECAQSEPQLVLPAGFWSGVPLGAAVQIEFETGYQDAPKPLTQAMILIIKAWFEAGIAVEKTEYIKVSFGCRALIKQNRYRRPRIYGDS